MTPRIGTSVLETLVDNVPETLDTQEEILFASLGSLGSTSKKRGLCVCAHMYVYLASSAHVCKHVCTYNIRSTFYLSIPIWLLSETGNI